MTRFFETCKFCEHDVICKCPECPEKDKKIMMLLGALKEIAKGEGAFSLDPLKHAGNTVENMKEIAQNAIVKDEGIDDD